MRKPTMFTLLFALATLVGGCWSNNGDQDNAAASDSYTVTVTGADIVNKDSGQRLSVGGMPLDGGTLNLN